ncbi:DUF4340 domain-containing protein [Falsiroseomonas selenitidurans]|uniref:DUF4340 domain-containing protein n=1 Tax=Falsiroseomonas selenitidurans TaxID=2716335 RepID=A0ABX1E5D0_9PROT|nr:DUF4340 domain-containing protein [Falsiroseomonas selenitidurans]NKC30145.1 DUF4340 domain-containing protein [Falsiroseomonas selenitidurans]
MKRRAIIGLGVAAAAAVGGAILLTPDRAAPPPPSASALAFPGLAARLAEAATIEVKRHDGTLLVRRAAPDTWVLPAKAGYPVRPERVRELLVGLTELRLTEPRTANPEMLDRLGLDDPEKPGATSSLLRVLDAEGRPVMALVVGRRRVRVQGNVPESVYVRRPDETQAWLAEGRLPLDADPNLWIDRDLANIPRDRVRSATVDRVGEPPLVLRRGPELEAKLAVVQPAATPELDEISLDEVARAFEFLTFLDVRTAAEIPGERLGSARFELTDNLILRVILHKEGETLWGMLAAEGDEEAARLNARWQGWAYQLGQWKEKAFLPRLSDLRRQEAAPPAPETPGPETPAPEASAPEAPAPAPAPQ